MKRVIGLVALAALISAASVTAPAQASNDYVASEEYFASSDGTKLYAQVFRPADVTEDDETPVVLVITPYQMFLKPGVDPLLLYSEMQDDMKLFENGYTVVQVSLRGYGKSDGCGDLGGPGEQMDAVAAVEWAASQPWSTGKVGTYGVSYDAWAGIMAAAGDAPLAASVVSSPLIAAYRGLYMNGIHYDLDWHAATALYAADDATSPGLPGTGVSECSVEGAQGGTGDNDPSSSYWQARDLVRKAATSDVPTFWAHGFLDSATKPDNILDVYSNLRGPTRAWFGQFEHGAPTSESGNESFFEETLRFFERHLKGKPVPTDPAVEVQEGSEGTWRAEKAWPPRDARYLRLPMKPGTYEDAPQDDFGPATSRGTWTFSQPLPYDVHIAGVPRVSFKVDAAVAGVNLHARVFDVSPEGATLISRGAMLVDGGGDGSVADGLVDEPVAFDLYPQDWVVAKGHRLALLVSGADSGWFDPGVTGTAVTAEGSFALPFLRRHRDDFIPATAPSQDIQDSALTLSNEFIEEQTVEMPLPRRLR